MPWQLWFKHEYVEPIFTGAKRARHAHSAHAVRPGDQVVACVGPSRPFALLRVLDVTLTTLAELDRDYRAGVRAIYPDVDQVWIVTFDVVQRIAKSDGERPSEQFAAERQPARAKRSGAA